MKLVIKSPIVMRVLAKIFNLEPMSVNFRYEKSVYDNDVTRLGFLNQVREEFNEQVKAFNSRLNQEIEEEVSDIK